MAYSMRFFITETKPVSISLIEIALSKKNANYRFEPTASTLRESGNLIFNDIPIGQVIIKRPGDGAFEKEMVEFIKKTTDLDESNIQKLDSVPGPQDDKSEVLKKLKETKTTIHLVVLFKDEDVEITFKRIDPLWEYCFKTFDGILQADGEGFYSIQGLLLRMQ